MDWFEAISGIWQGPPNDHAHGVVKVTAAHLLFKADGQCFFRELGHVSSLFLTGEWIILG
jgi:hypothetical protein